MKDANIFIDDILESMNKIERYITALSFNEFKEKEMVVDAVLRNIEVIGEAARNLPDSFRNKSENIPWRQMIGMRNIVIHEYFGVDLSIIWEIIIKDIPKAKKMIEKLI